MEKYKLENQTRANDIKENILEQLNDEIDTLEENKENLIKDLQQNLKSIEMVKNKSLSKKNCSDREAACKANIQQQQKFKEDLIKIREKHADKLDKAQEYVDLNKKNLEIAEFIIKSLSMQSAMSKEFSYYYEQYSKRALLNFDDYRNSKVDIIIDYYCPLSRTTMLDPYITECGHSFEYKYLVEFTEKNKDSKCPICKKSLNIEKASQNVKLRQIINDWYRQSLLKPEAPEGVIKNSEEYENALAEEKSLVEKIDGWKKQIEFNSFRLREIRTFIKQWQEQKKIDKGDKLYNEIEPLYNKISELSNKETISSKNKQFETEDLTPKPPLVKTNSIKPVSSLVANSPFFNKDNSISSFKSVNNGGAQITGKTFVAQTTFSIEPIQASITANPPQQLINKVSIVTNQSPPQIPPRPLSTITNPPPPKPVIQHKPSISNQQSSPPPPPPPPPPSLNMSTISSQPNTPNQDRSDLMAAIRNFGGNMSKLNKCSDTPKKTADPVKKEPQKSGNSLMDALNNALLKRRNDLNGNNSSENDDDDDDDDEDFDASF